MKNRDLEDAAGIEQAIRMQQAQQQAAPAIAQAANPQADFVNYLQNIAGGQAPDFNKLYESRQAQKEAPARGKEEFNLKNVLSYLADAVGHAAKANKENPRSGVLSALASGSGAAFQQREEKHKAKHMGMETLRKDLQKVAEDQRKYGFDKAKADRDAKSKDISDELHKAQTAKALREPTGGNVNWMDKLLATHELNNVGRKEDREFATQQRKYEREEKTLGEDMAKLPEIDNLSQAVDRMKQLSPDLPGGYFSDVKKGSSKLTSALGLSDGKWAASSEEFKNLSLPIIKDYIKIFGPQISNEDRIALEKLLAGEHMEQGARDRALNNMDVKIKTDQLRTLAKEKYFDDNGTTSKFDSVWSKLLKQYPLKDQKTGGVNVNNYKALQQSMSGNNKVDKQVPHQAQQQLPSQRVEQIMPQDIQKLKAANLSVDEIKEELRLEGYTEDQIDAIDLGE